MMHLSSAGSLQMQDPVMHAVLSKGLAKHVWIKFRFGVCWGCKCSAWADHGAMMIVVAMTGTADRGAMAPRHIGASTAVPSAAAMPPARTGAHDTRRSQEPYWDHIGTILGPYWDHFIPTASECRHAGLCLFAVEMKFTECLIRIPSDQSFDDCQIRYDHAVIACLISTSTLDHTPPRDNSISLAARLDPDRRSFWIFRRHVSLCAAIDEVRGLYGRVVWLYSRILMLCSNSDLLGPLCTW